MTGGGGTITIGMSVTNIVNNVIGIPHIKEANIIYILCLYEVHSGAFGQAFKCVYKHPRNCDNFPDTVDQSIATPSTPIITAPTYSAGHSRPTDKYFPITWPTRSALSSTTMEGNELWRALWLRRHYHAWIHLTTPFPARKKIRR